MIPRPRRDLSVKGAKQPSVLNDANCRCVAEGDGGFKVNESRDKEGEAAEDAMGRR